MSEATETSLAFRYGDPGTGMCWWLWDSQSVQGSPLLCIPLGIVHPYTFSSQHLLAQPRGLIKRREPHIAFLSG